MGRTYWIWYARIMIIVVALFIAALVTGELGTYGLPGRTQNAGITVDHGRCGVELYGSPGTFCHPAGSNS